MHSGLISRVGSWGGVLLIAATVVFGIFHLHQQRPGAEVLVLTQARFAPAAALVPPATESYTLAVELPDDWRSRPDSGSTGWYRIDLNLQVAPNRLWGIYLPNLEMTPEVFLNGVMIGGFSPDQPLARFWNRPLYFSIPSGLLKPGPNVIEVRLAANGHWGRLGEIYTGPDAVLRPHFERRQLLRVSVLQVSTVVGLVVSVFIAALYLAQQGSIYGWFALFSAGWTLQNYFVLTVDVPMPNPLWDLFIYVTLGFMLVTGSMFTLRFLEVRRARWEHLLIGTCVLGPLTLVAILQFDYDWFSQVSTGGWFLGLLLLMVYPLLLMARAVSRLGNMEVVALFSCYIVILTLAIHDWSVVTGIGNRHEGLMLQYAATPTFVTFGAILVRRFVLALRESNQLRSHLQSMVDAKTLEIEAAAKRFQELEVQRMVSSERERLMRDMHDGIGSQLIGVVSRLAPADEREQEIGRELRLALDDLRMMIDSLDDVGDDLAGVLGLFRNRIQPQLDDAGLALSWNVDDLPTVSGLGPERVLHFLRMMQEVVTNVIKHAAATHLRVTTNPRASISGRLCVAVEIEDDGVGLADGFAEGRGFRNLRHRAQVADLCFAVKPTANGTLVRLGVPITKEEHA